MRPTPRLPGGAAPRRRDASVPPRLASFVLLLVCVLVALTLQQAYVFAPERAACSEREAALVSALRRAQGGAALTATLRAEDQAGAGRGGEVEEDAAATVRCDRRVQAQELRALRARKEAAACRAKLAAARGEAAPAADEAADEAGEAAETAALRKRLRRAESGAAESRAQLLAAREEVKQLKARLLKGGRGRGGNGTGAHRHS